MATAVAAAKALRMNSYSNRVPMIVALHVVAAGHHEEPAIQPYDLDLRTVEAREGRAVDDVGHTAERGVAVTQIQDPVERGEQRIELVGAEEHGDLQLLLDPPHEFDDLMLVSWIEAHEG